MTEEDSYISTLLCEIELIHSDVTCFAKAEGQHMIEMARAVELLGLRACLTESIMDSGEGLPATWGIRTTDEYIQSQKKLYVKHHNTADGRIRIWLGIRQVMNSTDRLLLETRDAAKKLKRGIHMHVVKIPYENEVVMDTRKVDHEIVIFLDKIDFLQNNLLAAHTVWVNDSELMRYLAFLINKGREVYTRGTTDPTAFSAERVLKMVTFNGAKSVLWDNEIGSLEIGKKANMVVVNLFSWSMVPVHD